MDISISQRRPRSESIVPMINVVFLLLIFFLMTSHLATPEPFEVAPPEADSLQQPESDAVLYVDRAGRISFLGQEGEAALDALSGATSGSSTIQVRADNETEASVIAGLLQKLAQRGLTNVELVVTPK